MPPGTLLLGDDGTASVATAMMMSHHAFRRDLAQLEAALGDGPVEEARAAVLKEAWTGFRMALHGHHTVEDSQVFPTTRTAHPHLAAAIDGLDADHKRIDPLLARGDGAFSDVAATPADARAVVAALFDLLDAHLVAEEAHVIPTLRATKEFPPPTGDEMLAMYAAGFAWSSYGIAPDVLARVDAMAPPELSSRLPAARAAFAASFEKMWGRTLPAASTRSVPAGASR